MIPTREKSRFEWRVIEYPSTRLRLRAMCNEIKKELLNDEWSPYESQTTRLFEKLKGDYFDERTYESWWKGEHYPQKKHIERIKEISEKSTSWLEHTPVGSPLLRHLYAIDSGCFQYTKDHPKYHEINDERLKNTYEAIHSVWEIFTTDGYKTTQNILDFTQQAPNAKVDHITKNEFINTNSYHLPRDVRNSYRHDDPKSIFLFLIKYSMHSLLSDSDILDIWVLEMASLSLLLGKAF